MAGFGSRRGRPIDYQHYNAKRKITQLYQRDNLTYLLYVTILQSLTIVNIAWQYYERSNSASALRVNSAAP